MTWRTHTLATAIKFGDTSEFDVAKKLPFELRLVAIRCNFEQAGIFSVSIVLIDETCTETFVEKADPSTLARLTFDNLWKEGLVVQVIGTYSGFCPAGYWNGSESRLTFDFFGETK
jgi:hypothetical protein